MGLSLELTFVNVLHELAGVRPLVLRLFDAALNLRGVPMKLQRFKSSLGFAGETVANEIEEEPERGFVARGAHGPQQHRTPVAVSRFFPCLNENFDRGGKAGSAKRQCRLVAD